MPTYEKSRVALSELFGKDVTFVLSTASENVPSSRVVDTYYDGNAFWIVTYGASNKVKEIMSNPHVALCNGFHVFKGKAHNVGHPRTEENKAIRERLITVFEPWYFAHNNEDDEAMCYVKFEPETGFFHKDGVGYSVDFSAKEAREIPFSPEI